MRTMGDPESFRDPSGHVFRRGGKIFIEASLNPGPRIMRLHGMKVSMIMILDLQIYRLMKGN